MKQQQELTALLFEILLLGKSHWCINFWCMYVCRFYSSCDEITATATTTNCIAV
jgi:hypothetical protein